MYFFPSQMDNECPIHDKTIIIWRSWEFKVVKFDIWDKVFAIHNWIGPRKQIAVRQRRNIQNIFTIVKDNEEN